jgi:hypothetical protein
MEQQIREGIAKALAMLLTPEAQQVLTASIMLAIALRGAWGVTLFTGRQTARAWTWLTTEAPPPPPKPAPPLGRVAQSLMAALAGVLDVKSVSNSKEKGNYDVSSTHGLFAVWRGGLDSIAVKGVNCQKHLTPDEWHRVHCRVGDVIHEHEAQLKRQEENAVASSLGFLSMTGHVLTNVSLTEAGMVVTKEEIPQGMPSTPKCSGNKKSA